MSSLISLGQRSMAAAMAQLTTTGNNISNANVAGYSRQEVKLATAGGQFTGDGFFGRGVDVATVSRAHDDFLTREAATAKAQSSSDASRLSQLKRLEQVFPTGEQGLGYAAGDLINSFVDVANSPQDPSARQVVLSQAEQVASRFRDAGTQIDALQSGVTSELKDSVVAVNQITRQIATVNRQIASFQGIGHAPNDLLDKRDGLVSDLSQYLRVSTMAADNGSISVYTGNGQALVVGTRSTDLSVKADSFDAQRVQVALANSTGGQVAIPSESLDGGSIGGLLRFQDDDLRTARNLLGQLSVGLASSLNEQQALGLDLSNPAGSGAPLFSTPAPKALPSSFNQKDASGNYVAAVSLTISDATALQASEYELHADPSGSGAWQLERLSDGQRTTVADGDTVDGMTISLGSPPPAATDSFLLQPVANAARGMKRVLDNPNGIAAASPVAATLAATNTGTLSIASVGAVNASLDSSLSAAITFTSNSGDYDWELRDSSNAVVSSGSATWQAGTPIALNGFQLAFNGVPRSGDAVTVARSPNTMANNGNALALAALGSQAMVGSDSITDAYAQAMTNIGVRVQSTQTASDISTSVAQATKTANDNESGVNLDEEAARLIQYQQAYQASAKVLQVAQTLFDSLLQLASR